MTTKNLLIELLKKSREPISGEELAKELGVSRTMVWKHIQSLIEEGFEIEAVKKKGYKLTNYIEPLSEVEIQKHLRTSKFARQMTLLDSCSSTQVVAHELLLSNEYDGHVIISEEQTEGKGRLGREWNSSKGKGLWMSWIMKPNILPHEAPPITLVASLAVAAAIENVTGIQADIKWPNDLLIKGKKFGGILTELQSTPDQIEAIIMGIGLNINHDFEDFSPDLQSIATSVAIEKGEKVERAQIIAEIANQLEASISLFEQQGFLAFKDRWESQSSMIGKPVSARTIRESIEGVAVGINEYGALLVATSTGIRPLFSGDVTLSKKLVFKPEYDTL